MNLNTQDFKLLSNIIHDLGFKNVLELKYFVMEMPQSWSNEILRNNAVTYLTERTKYYEDALSEYRKEIEINKERYNQYFDYILQT